MVDLAQAVERSLGVLEQQKALGRRCHARAVAYEKRIADFGLQFLHQPRNGRLRPAQQPRGACEAAYRHDGGEGFELTEFHGRNDYLKFE